MSPLVRPKCGWKYHNNKTYRILKKWDGVGWNGLNCLGVGTGSGP